jgi:hypothetical protein
VGAAGGAEPWTAGSAAPALGLKSIRPALIPTANAKAIGATFRNLATFDRRLSVFIGGFLLQLCV